MECIFVGIWNLLLHSTQTTTTAINHASSFHKSPNSSIFSTFQQAVWNIRIYYAFDPPTKANTVITATLWVIIFEGWNFCEFHCVCKNTIVSSSSFQDLHFILAWNLHASLERFLEYSFVLYAVINALLPPLCYV